MSALTGDLARAAREFDQARRDLDASGHRPLRAIADHDEALMLVRGGSPDAARVGALLAEALGAFRSLGMAGWERRAAALRASTGPAPTGRPPGGLTPREVEVLQLISAGRTTRQIAEAMIVSRATVERHITSLYRKIGARPRGRHLLRAAPRRGRAALSEGFPSPCAAEGRGGPAMAAAGARWRMDGTTRRQGGTPCGSGSWSARPSTASSSTTRPGDRGRRWC
jgi:DNA-binding CsgD family transcriptional regulator